MPRITVEDEESFEAPEGKRLVLCIEDAGIDILHRCGGNAICNKRTLACPWGRRFFIDGRDARVTCAPVLVLALVAPASGSVRTYSRDLLWLISNWKPKYRLTSVSSRTNKLNFVSRRPRLLL